ncbi:hypothetical protein CDAR_518091 [Caerostris darwini]|uniref:Uncharacterized protein n=1 Tax=Caerostris darwini TaxID=1538125 RepID=A0AAV4VH58_9ARAC|nr:hypothetical protein CDAR_518091 [Caerostris darwini]
MSEIHGWFAFPVVNRKFQVLRGENYFNILVQYTFMALIALKMLKGFHGENYGPLSLPRNLQESLGGLQNCPPLRMNSNNKFRSWKANIKELEKRSL